MINKKRAVFVFCFLFLVSFISFVGAEENSEKCYFCTNCEPIPETRTLNIINSPSCCNADGVWQLEKAGITNNPNNKEGACPYWIAEKNGVRITLFICNSDRYGADEQFGFSDGTYVSVECGVSKIGLCTDSNGNSFTGVCEEEKCERCELSKNLWQVRGRYMYDCNGAGTLSGAEFVGGECRINAECLSECNTNYPNQYPPNKWGDCFSSCDKREAGQVEILKEICDGKDNNYDGLVDITKVNNKKEYACHVNLALGINQEQFKLFPVDKEEYLKETDFLIGEEKKSYLVISQYDDLVCEFQTSSDYITSATLKVGEEIKDAVCEKQKGKNFKKCYAIFTGEKERGSKIKCELKTLKINNQEIEIEESERKSKEMVVAKYIFYFIKVNQGIFMDSWSKVKEQYTAFSEISKSEKDVSYAVKPVFLTKEFKYGKKDYLDFDRAKRCSFKKSFLEKVYSELKNIIPVKGRKHLNMNSEDRVIIVSSDIINEHFQCKEKALEALEKRLRKEGKDLGMFPASVVYAGLYLFPATAEKAVDSIQKGTGFFISLPAKPLKGIFFLGNKLTRGGLGYVVDKPYEVIISIKQLLLGTEKNEISFPKKNKILVKTTGSANKNTLIKALARTYEELCYEDNMEIYRIEKQTSSCKNYFPPCCIDGVGAKLLGSIKRLGFHWAPVPGLSILDAVIKNPEDYKILGSCGASYKCPGWPINYFPDEENKNKIEPPNSVMGYLGKELVFTPTDKGPFEEPDIYAKTLKKLKELETKTT